MIKVAHIINPVLAKASSDLYIAQPITFRSMRVAQQQAQGHLSVDLVAVGYAEDERVMPDGFSILPPLTRSIMDVGTFQEQRKLPLLTDILRRFYDSCEADYFIYTNVDIGLQPNFYLAVNQFFDHGFDTFVINRRTIPDSYSEVNQLPQMWAEVGKPHRGWDCFIFPRALVPHFKLGTVCVGVPRVGLALLANLVAFGRSFSEFKDVTLTFHIGDDRQWNKRAFKDFRDHNTREIMKILAELELETGSFGRRTIPGSFLWRMRTFGPLYEFWSRYAYLPPRLSLLLNRLLRDHKSIDEK